MLQPTDRILTPTGLTGTILPQPWGMPFHHLVQLDDGRKRWFLGEILELECRVLESNQVSQGYEPREETVSPSR